MPLLDHFHPPLDKRRHAEGFHNEFAAAISNHLNLNVLSEQYLAEFQIHVGQQVEIDVATYDYGAPEKEDRGGGTATAVIPAAVWTPPVPLLQMPAIFPDTLEIQILNLDSARELVAAIELVSLGNKDRPKSRLAFATKCAAYLQRRIGVVTIDIVTGRTANLHNELIDLLESGDDYKMLPEPTVYAVAYRPVHAKDVERIDMWPVPLSVGGQLPLLPLALATSACVPLDLEAAYMEACRRSRLVASG